MNIKFTQRTFIIIAIVGIMSSPIFVSAADDTDKEIFSEILQTATSIVLDMQNSVRNGDGEVKGVQDQQNLQLTLSALDKTEMRVQIIQLKYILQGLVAQISNRSIDLSSLRGDVAHLKDVALKAQNHLSSTDARIAKNEASQFLSLTRVLSEVAEKNSSSVFKDNLEKTEEVVTQLQESIREALDGNTVNPGDDSSDEAETMFRFEKDYADSGDQVYYQHSIGVAYKQTPDWAYNYTLEFKCEDVDIFQKATGDIGCNESLKYKSNGSKETKRHAIKIDNLSNSTQEIEAILVVTDNASGKEIGRANDAVAVRKKGTKGLLQGVSKPDIELSLESRRGSGDWVGYYATWDVASEEESEVDKYKVTTLREDINGKATTVEFTEGNSMSRLNPNAGEDDGYCYYFFVRVDALDRSGDIIATDNESGCYMADEENEPGINPHKG
ncbi:MAG: hypothetical protein WD335_00890 [Candidatus Paceibacterota bacterium]